MNENICRIVNEYLLAHSKRDWHRCSELRKEIAALSADEQKAIRFEAQTWINRYGGKIQNERQRHHPDQTGIMVWKAKQAAYAHMINL